MIVRDIMATKLVTIEPDATLAHAATLFRQHRFHHLPVTRKVTTSHSEPRSRQTRLMLEGLITAQDIDLAATLYKRSGNAMQQPWQERLVVEVMHRAFIRVTPATPVPAAAQILVERSLTYLPVVEYEQIEQESKTILVGLLTRTDLLLAFSRTMGAFEPGMQLNIMLPMGNMAPLARTLSLAAELHVPVRSVIAAPLFEGMPQVATVRLGTINPSSLLIRLQKEEIAFSFGAPLAEGNAHA